MGMPHVPTSRPAHSDFHALLSSLPSDDDANSLFAQQAAHKLRNAMQLPARNPRIAHWLFSHKNLPFHPDSPTLTPESFEHALAIRIVHEFNDLGLDPVRFFNGYVSASPQSAESSLNLIFTPVMKIGRIIVGYTLGVGAVFDARMHPFAHMVPNRGSMRGRFAFDPESKRMVCVLNNISDYFTGIISLTWLHNSCRERAFFSVPNRQYSYADLPTQVLVVLSNMEYKVSTMSTTTHPHTAPNDSDHTSTSSAATTHLEHIPDPVDTHPSSHTSDPPADFPNDLWDQSTAQLTHEILNSLSPDLLTTPDTIFDIFPSPTTHAQPHTESAMSPIRSLFENYSSFQQPLRHKSPPRRPRLSTGPFDMTALKASLDDLENCLYGVYYGPNLKRDVLHPVTGEITSRATGEMTENLLPLDISTRARMRFYAAQNYFESITAPGSERWLTRYGDMTRGDSQGDMTVAKHSDAAKRARVEKHAKMHVGEPVLLPRVKEVCGKCACELGGEGGEVLDVESVKEMKREMKRRKNRLSAARSNQRRKEKVEAEKKELERLKVRREELAGVQKRLKEENELLKQQTGTAS